MVGGPAIWTSCSNLSCTLYSVVSMIHSYTVTLLFERKKRESRICKATIQKVVHHKYKYQLISGFLEEGTYEGYEG